MYLSGTILHGKSTSVKTFWLYFLVYQAFLVLIVQSCLAGQAVITIRKILYYQTG